MMNVVGPHRQPSTICHLFLAAFSSRYNNNMYNILRARSCFPLSDIPGRGEMHDFLRYICQCRPEDVTIYITVVYDDDDYTYNIYIRFRPKIQPAPRELHMLLKPALDSSKLQVRGINAKFRITESSNCSAWFEMSRGQKTSELPSYEKKIRTYDTNSMVIGNNKLK